MIMSSPLTFVHITLSRIDFEDFMIYPNGMMVVAFDGTKTSACGEVDLKILMGPCKFEVSFVVVDIRQFSICSLDDLGFFSFPLSLHQRFKFISGNKLVFVMAEEDIPVSASTIVPFMYL